MRLIFGLLVFLTGVFAVFSAMFPAVSSTVFPVVWAGTLDTRPGIIRMNSLTVTDQNYQVRVEQRVIIRVPRQRVPSPAQIKMGAARTAPVRLKEGKIGKCLMMDTLAGSRPGPKDSLELVTVDGSLIRAYLGDGCLSREFYAGAYMERSDDGRLCVDRDLVHARTGARCSISKLRILLPE